MPEAGPIRRFDKLTLFNVRKAVTDAIDGEQAKFIIALVMLYIVLYLCYVYSVLI